MEIDREKLIAKNVLGDNIGVITLADHMGSEKTITDRARICYLSEDRSTPESDQRLLKQLVIADLIHGTPLRSVHLLFKVKLPLFVMRQWTRHLVGNDHEVMEWSSLGQHTFDWGGSFDEMSGRYVDFSEKPEFYDPTNMRPNLSLDALLYWDESIQIMLFHYQHLRSLGVPKELARSFIPQNIYTHLNWSVNLQGLMTWYEHRKKGSGAQAEHVAYAEAALALVEVILPNAVKYIKERVG